MEHHSIYEALKELGEDPDTIARTLFVRGLLVGIRGDCWECPVSHYLRSRGVISPAVSRCNITYGSEGSRAILPTPDVISEFMRRFDNTEYPYLIKIKYY